MTYSMLFSSHRLIKVLELFAAAAILIAILRPQLGRAFYSRLDRKSVV